MSAKIIVPLSDEEAEKRLPIMQAAYDAGISAAEFRMLYCCIMFDHGEGESARISRKLLWRMSGRPETEAEELISKLEDSGWLSMGGRS